jgi:1-deoxy-D-xylulose-5-phosphate reductoisomerase
MKVRVQGRLGISLLGATGSIGETARRVIARHPDRFRIVAMTANRDRAKLAAAAVEWPEARLGLVEPGADPIPSQWCGGRACLVAAATDPDAHIVLNAIVGAAGLEATLAAVGVGKRVALANKESLVVGGALVERAVKAGGGEIIPVDSEHSALLQCLTGRIGGPGPGLHPVQGVRRMVITASGGPFRTWDAARIAAATREDALKHPTWAMGRKITVDSATLVNKALEVIEAHVLFGIPYDRIEVVVHPQSIVHSMVEFDDGSVLAQLGVPSMELPVLYALSHPDRVADAGVPRFDPVASSPLTFEPVRHEAFPALALGVAAGRTGGAAPAVFNAANEVAVSRFLDGSLPFGAIPASIDRALDRLGGMAGKDLSSLLAADAAARSLVQEYR